MHLRSQGQENLLPLLQDIKPHERAISRLKNQQQEVSRENDSNMGKQTGTRTIGTDDIPTNFTNQSGIPITGSSQQQLRDKVKPHHNGGKSEVSWLAQRKPIRSS
ncbi:unnamed protein product [Cochlearia groenlandica]